MSKILLASLLTISSLAFAGNGAPKAKAAKVKTTTCSASCPVTASCKPAARVCGPGCPLSPGCPASSRK